MHTSSPLYEPFQAQRTTKYPVNLPDLSVFYVNQGPNTVFSVGDFVSKPDFVSKSRPKIRGWRSADAGKRMAGGFVAALA